MRILFLDDNQERHSATDRIYSDHTVHHCYTVDQLVWRLGDGDWRYDVVSLDHDLNDFDAKSERNGVELTGLDACVAIVTGYLHRMPETVIIHSVNPCGAVAMRSLLQNRGVGARWLPFANPEPDESDPYWQP